MSKIKEIKEEKGFKKFMIRYRYQSGRLMAHDLARLIANHRLDELIWVTGARINDEDLPFIQRRIKELQEMVEERSGWEAPTHKPNQTKEEKNI